MEAVAFEPRDTLQSKRSISRMFLFSIFNKNNKN